jgi:hypothetical protein
MINCHKKYFDCQWLMCYRITLQHTIEQPIGYPHRPPSLRLESRRTSISMDDVVRRASSASASSSPDSNLLRVQANLPGILVAPSSPTGSFSLSRGPSATNLHMRRHSSVGPQDPRFSFMSTSHKVSKLFQVFSAIIAYL